MEEIKMNKKPLVFVKVLAYNHAHYIAQCLDGIIMQKTNFPFVAIVHDDASQDETPKIILEYGQKYPDIIKPVLSKTNKYSQGKLDDFLHEQCQKADYVAVCEGDDYWTDPCKLQKQIDILESDVSLMGCCTDRSIIDDQGNILARKKGNVVKGDLDGRYNLRDFFRDQHQYPTLTMVYRNIHKEELRAKHLQTINPFLGDWTFWIILLTYGDIYYLDEVTAAYRINPTSVTHSGGNARRLGLAKANFKIIPAVASILPEEYQDIKSDLMKNTAWMWFSLANAYKHMHRYVEMAVCLLICGIKDPKMLYSKVTKAR